jgi:hypothetical protein
VLPQLNREHTLFVQRLRSNLWEKRPSAGSDWNAPRRHLIERFTDNLGTSQATGRCEI